MIREPRASYVGNKLLIFFSVIPRGSFKRLGHSFLGDSPFAAVSFVATQRFSEGRTEALREDPKETTHKHKVKLIKSGGQKSSLFGSFVFFKKLRREEIIK